MLEPSTGEENGPAAQVPCELGQLVSGRRQIQIWVPQVQNPWAALPCWEVSARGAGAGGGANPVVRQVRGATGEGRATSLELDRSWLVLWDATLLPPLRAGLRTEALTGRPAHCRRLVNVLCSHQAAPMRSS